VNLPLLWLQVLEMIGEHCLIASSRRSFSHMRSRRSRAAFDVQSGTDASGKESLLKLDSEPPNTRYGGRYEAITDG
jgi:hypothetical protein